jgi:hypothetical protein
MSKGRFAFRILAKYRTKNLVCTFLTLNELPPHELGIQVDQILFLINVLSQVDQILFLINVLSMLTEIHLYSPNPFKPQFGVYGCQCFSSCFVSCG